jgi:hypothetical protein
MHRCSHVNGTGEPRHQVVGRSVVLIGERRRALEVKSVLFQPEHAGTRNFYVALVDDTLRRDYHNETVGILICGTKNDRSVRYSLGRSSSPVAVAAYTYDKLPEAEQHALPDERYLVAALEWAEPGPDSEDSR